MADTTLYAYDSSVSEGSPDDNSGTSTMLSVKVQSGQVMRSFLKFDLSPLPAGAIISLATLRMYCWMVGLLFSPYTDVQARRVADDSWNEVDPDGITWNNQPDHGDVEDTVVPAVGWVEWDVTAFIVDEFAGDKVASMCMRSVNESLDANARFSVYRSKEANGDDPELYIEYTVPAPPQNMTLLGIMTCKT